MNSKNQSSLPEIDTVDGFSTESLHEFIKEIELVEDYKKLKERCDSVINKIKTRKKKVI
jgi:hypothetical protein